jgi:hypothetical protein
VRCSNLKDTQRSFDLVADANMHIVDNNLAVFRATETLCSRYHQITLILINLNRKGFMIIMKAWKPS